MKTFLTVGLVVGMALGSLAGPVYVNKSASGSTGAEVIFAADANTQPRIVFFIGTSDKAGSVFSFKSGTIGLTVTSDTVNATNITVNSTNGIGPGATLVIQTAAGVCTTATTHSVLSGNTTNVWITATNSTVPAVGDSIYLLGTATTIKCGATTGTCSSDAVYVGNQGRPIRCVLDGTSACSVDSISAVYQ